MINPKIKQIKRRFNNVSKSKRDLRMARMYIPEMLWKPWDSDRSPNQPYTMFREFKEYMIRNFNFEIRILLS